MDENSRARIPFDSRSPAIARSHRIYHSTITCGCRIVTYKNGVNGQASPGEGCLSQKHGSGNNKLSANSPVPVVHTVKVSDEVSSIDPTRSMPGIIGGLKPG